MNSSFFFDRVVNLFHVQGPLSVELTWRQTISQVFIFWLLITCFVPLFQRKSDAWLSTFITVIIHLFFQITKYYFPQCNPKASRKRCLCPTLLSQNGLVCLSVTRTMLSYLFTITRLSWQPVFTCFSSAPGKGPGLGSAAVLIGCLLACLEPS